MFEETKLCKKCNIIQPITEFSVRDNKRRQYICKSCQKMVSNQWYLNNRQKQIDNIKRNNNLLRKKFQTWKTTLSCIICRENYVGCLDFHHLDPSQKDFAISRNTGTSIPKLIKELDKCVVLCKNCHVKVHSEIIILPQDISTCGISFKNFVLVA